MTLKIFYKSIRENCPRINQWTRQNLVFPWGQKNFQNRHVTVPKPYQNRHFEV